MKWQTVKLNDSEFEFITQDMEYEIIGTYTEDEWNCDLNYFKGAKPNKISVGTLLSSFTASSPEHAKELAEKNIS
jgi:hypothetical protein